MSYREEIEFLLHDWLGVESLSRHERFHAHNRGVYDAVLEMCEKLAQEKFAPFNRLADTEEPRFDGSRVVLPTSTRDAIHAYAHSGMLKASLDESDGGMQLPCVVEMAANSFFHKASIALSSNAMLTRANANLLLAHGTPAQRLAFAKPTLDGRFAGTMCLSEPQAGSSLSDITTRAVADGQAHEEDRLGPRYRLHGHKMWITAGDHELNENIIHLVLAKVPGADGRLEPGARSISLFVVPKFLVDEQGDLTGERNDVVVAGLNHKLGYRGIPNTLLNFGEGSFVVAGKAGAIGYRVGDIGDGLRCMFHMMNEARIAIGLGATALGHAGYQASLEYARLRRQGRPAGRAGKDASQPPVAIIEHADVRRMLLAQKSYCDGALALSLYCARLVDETRVGDEVERIQAHELLELLTPVAKSWPSEWCLEANSLAIQIHGGSGYTRDFPVEQYWRDNRLNMIHEGTHGIQALDLLGRKIMGDAGRSMKLLSARIAATIEAVPAASPLASHATALDDALSELHEAAQSAWTAQDPVDALANATPYLQAFGHTVIAWMWLQLASTAESGKCTASKDLIQGQLAACRYFYRWELPRVALWLRGVKSQDDSWRAMQDAWF